MTLTRDRAASHANPPATQSPVTLPALLLGLAWLVIWGLGMFFRTLGEPDEGRYAEVAREMFASGDWITPRLDGFNFFDKPPLHYWAGAAAYTLFGVHPWSARLWCVLCGLIAIVAIGWAGARVFGRDAGAYAAAILGSSMLFVFSGHLNTLDMGVTAFLALGMACFLVAQFDPSAAPIRTRLNLLMWFALALAVLSKGLIGVVFPGMILAVYMLWQRSWSVLGKVSLLPGVVLLLVVCAPWFTAVMRLHADFFDYFFIREHFTRFLTSEDQRGKPPGFFLPVVVLGIFPWTLMLPWSRTSWRAIYAGLPAQRFLLVWVGLIFAFFSVSHSELPFYILPLFPALAMLLGQAVTVLPAALLARRLRWMAGMAGVAAAAVLALLLFRHAKATSAGMPQLLIGAMVALCLIAAAALAGTYLLRREQRRGAIHLLALAALSGWVLMLLSSQPYVLPRSAQPAASMIRPLLGPHTEVFAVQTYMGGLAFYLDRLVTVVDQPRDDLSPGVASRPDGYIADLAGFEQRWRASSDAVALIPDSQLAHFEQDGLRFRVVGRTAAGVVIQRVSPPLH